MKFRLTLFFALICCSFSLFANDKIKIVVTAAFVSEKGINVYSEIADYLSNKLNTPVALVTGTSYEESDMLLDRGIVQIGFICGLPYTQKHREGKYRLIAMPVMAIDNKTFPDTPSYKGTPGKYFSYTIVHKDSPISSWRDLKGRHYIYNDQSSNSGYNMPRYKLIQLGVHRWEDYFSRISVSGSHEESIRSVANGYADASSVDSLVLDYDRSINDKDALNVKVIDVLFPGGAGVPPVVANQSVSEEQRQAMEDALVEIHKAPEGKIVLKKALISHFARPDDSNYDFIRQMEAAATEARFIDHVE